MASLSPAAIRAISAASRRVAPAPAFRRGRFGRRRSGGGGWSRAAPLEAPQTGAAKSCAALLTGCVSSLFGEVHFPPPRLDQLGAAAGIALPGRLEGGNPVGAEMPEVAAPLAPGR